MSTFLASAADVVNTYEYAASGADPNLRLRTTCDGLGEKVSCISWNHTNQVIAVGGNDRRITLVQSNNGQFLSSIPFGDGQAAITDRITDLCFSGNSRYLASSSGRKVMLWDLKKRSLKTTLPGETGDLTCLTLGADGAQCVSGDKGGVVRLWDVKRGRYQNMKPAAAQTALVSPVMCLDQPAPHLVSSPRVGSGDGAGALAIWDLATGAQTSSNVVHSGGVASLAFSPKNGRLVATCGPDGRLCLIDVGVHTGEPSASTELLDGALTRVSFHENAIQCAVGTASGWLHLYDWRNTRQPLCSIRAHPDRAVSALAFQRPQAPSSGTTSAAAATPAAPRREERERDTPLPVAPSPLMPSRSPAREPKSAKKERGTPERAKTASTSKTSPRRLVRIAQEEEAAAAAAAEAGASMGVTVELDGLSLPLPSPPKWTVQGTPTVADPDPASAAAAGAASSASASVSPPAPAPQDGPSERFAQALAAAAQQTSSPIPDVDASASLSLYSTGGGVGMAGDRSVTSQSLYDIGDDGGGHNLLRSPGGGASDTSPARYAPPHYGGYAANNYDSRQSPGPTGMPGVPSGDAYMTGSAFQEALAGLRYDIHREVQSVVKEQVRQFALAKDDMQQVVGKLSGQMADLLQANAQLRAENERLRRIY